MPAATRGGTQRCARPGLSVAAFYDQFQAGSSALGIGRQIDRPLPFDLRDADRPFSADSEPPGDLRYCDVQAASELHQTVLDFYESAYQAGAKRAGWDIARFASLEGVTDPHAGS